MINQAVNIEKSETNPAITIVTITRAKHYNSITMDVFEGLLMAAEMIAADSNCRAVILTGEGEFFSSGADFSLFTAIETEEDTNQARIVGKKGAAVCNAWEALSQPTIVAIEGGVVGGGLAIAMACDWRVMGRGAYAYVPEVKMGVAFGWGSLPRLTRLIGAPKAKIMSILCRQHKADECAEWGLADYVTDNGGTLDKALEIAAEVAALPRLPVQLIKRGINATANALFASTGYADLEDLLLCAKDEEATNYRKETMKKLLKK